jgi:hypothetical protein
MTHNSQGLPGLTPFTAPIATSATITTNHTNRYGGVIYYQNYTNFGNVAIDNKKYHYYIKALAAAIAYHKSHDILLLIEITVQNLFDYINLPKIR